MSSTTLSYVVSGDSSFKFSLSLENSDYSANQNLLDHLISTLVKYGPSGHPEPYLAKSWQTSRNEHNWVFDLRTDLNCEDGTPITAESFAHNLHAQIKSLIKTSKVIDFDLLNGWEEFISGKRPTIDGIKVVANKIYFNFNHRPDDFLDTLRKVYFGFWCPAKSRGAAEANFSSSGSYRLVKIKNDGAEVVLQRRPNWFSVSSHSPEKIHFISSKPLEGTSSIMSLGLNPPLETPKGFRKIVSMPNWVVALVLTAKPDSIFNSQSHRQLFSKNLRKFMLERPAASKAFATTQSLFPVETIDAPANFEIRGELKAGKPLKFVYSRALPIAESSYLEDAIRSALPSDQEIEFSVVNRNRPNWLKPYLAAEQFDVRIQAVDVGGPVSNSAVKMMFCTKLGVSFPDSTQEICKLVEEYNLKDKIPDENYSVRLNHILQRTAEVIPLFHTGLVYLYSEGIEPTSITPQLIVPRLDLLRMN